MIKKLKTYDSDNYKLEEKMSRLAEKIVSLFWKEKILQNMEQIV